MVQATLTVATTSAANDINYSRYGQVVGMRSRINIICEVKQTDLYLQALAQALTTYPDIQPTMPISVVQCSSIGLLHTSDNKN